MLSESEVKAIISELNRVEVKGESNMDILLGCIVFLRHKLKKKQETQENIPVVTESTPVEVSDNG